MQTKMPNNTATQKAGSAKNCDNTIAGCHDSDLPTSVTIWRELQRIEDPIDLARHDKIILVQSLDLLGAQRDRRVTPAEADIGVVPFGFSQVADVAHKVERFPKNCRNRRFFRCDDCHRAVPNSESAIGNAPLLPA